MFRKIVMAVITTLAMGVAYASVDVNQADQAALDNIKGIGPTTSKAILEERKKGGNFKDWNDLQTRVKGIGEKSSEKYSNSGLTVNGASKLESTKPVSNKMTQGKKDKPVQDEEKKSIDTKK